MKYFKPKSLTWWASALPIFAGVFLALAPVHGLDSWSMAIGDLTGGAAPAVLINAGLAGIGFRGAMA